MEMGELVVLTQLGQVGSLSFFCSPVLGPHFSLSQINKSINLFKKCLCKSAS